jgi:large subunit ribosomal protein L22
MTTYNYSTNTKKPNCVKAVGISLPISLKKSIEICNVIRNKKLEKAKRLLERVIEKKEAIPYRRFNADIGHKPGIGPGRYPIKTCEEIKTLIERVEAAAVQKGLDTKSLVITHISAQKGGKRFHYGRKRRRMMKRAQIEVVAEERKEEKREEKKMVDHKKKAEKQSEKHSEHKDDKTMSTKQETKEK